MVRTSEVPVLVVGGGAAGSVREVEGAGEVLPVQVRDGWGVRQAASVSSASRRRGGTCFMGQASSISWDVTASQIRLPLSVRQTRLLRIGSM